MIGSTFIYVPDLTKLQALQSEGPNALDGFARVDMGVMLTLDFETFCGPASVEWSSGDPVIFDEEAGFGVFPVSAGGLQFVLNNSEKLDPEQQSDVEALRTFIAKHGAASIYEVATF